MDFRTSLKQQAIEIANDAQQGTFPLKKELAKLKERKLTLEVQIEAAGFTHQRAIDFRSQIDGDYQCPSCWVLHERRTALTPVAGGDEDRFECRVCHFETSFDS
jgi:hypothetical protein